MQCYTEIAPPTAVSHALHLPFLHSRSNNLVVAKNSLLQIFELKSTTTEVTPGGGNESENAAANLDTEAADVPLQRTENTAKLVLVAEFPLAGTVISLARVKALNTKSKGEALLVAFRDAKLSLVEWDPETYNLHTISIHYYENPDLPGIAPWSADLKDTYNFLTADPSSRCAALKFGTHNLAILPFRQPDLVEDDYDSDAEGPKQTKADQANGTHGEQKTPYSSSFVLPLTNLDPTLTHPVHLAFLHEYREPTFGIVAASQATAPSLLAQRKHILTYSVFTLDLEQKASTTLLSVSGLPYDITKVVPLPSPIGGALLVGGNEIIHVDQGGKTNGVAVNEFAKACTSFPLSDQSDLALHLEGCSLELLSQDTGDVLILLNNGRLLILTFTLDGRTVSGMTIQMVAADHGGHLIKSAASCTSNLGRGRLFIGSEDGESVMLGWTGSSNQLRRKQSNADLDGDDDSDQEEIDDMEDDLYNDTAPTIQKITAAVSEPTAPGTYTFRIHDVLPSIAPIKDAVLHPGKVTDSLNRGEIMLATGRGSAGAITALNRELHPISVATKELPLAHGVWAVHARKQAPGDVTAAFGEDTEANMATDVDYDQYLVVSKTSEDGTIVYEVNGDKLTETDKGDFEREEGTTLLVGVLAAGTKVVQVMRTEIRIYDSELNLVHIQSMEEEDDDGGSTKELNIINASFADPYLLILREDSSVKIYKANSDDELEEVEASGLSGTPWLSASLFKSSSFTEVFAFLLTPEGGLRVFAMSEMQKPCYVAEALSFLPPILTMDYVPKRSVAKATITEILAADLGDATFKSPHLIVSVMILFMLAWYLISLQIRTSSDNLVIYKAFHAPSRSASDLWTKNLRWVKLSQQHVPRYIEDNGSEDPGFESTLVALDNICGYSTVFQRGTTPAFIFREASSVPRVIGLSGKTVKSLTSFHTSSCQRGFAYLDSTDTLRICQLPPQTHYGHLGWATRRMPMDSEVHALTYHPSGLYIVGTGQAEEYQLDPTETYHYDLPKEDITFKPSIERGVVKLLDEKSWTVIDTHVLDPQEVVLSIKTLNLEVSETTHQRKDLIAVGTSIIHGEDLATKGCIRIFEVITVVPQPDRPETNKRLKLIVKDEVKGAVSAISELGTQGFLIMAQGQKCMVRGLKEDGTLLPVAFMDMQCYVSDLKNLPGTGMLAMGDAYRGVWFTGYTVSTITHSFKSLFSRTLWLITE